MSTQASAFASSGADSFDDIVAIPKIELHVHLEGSLSPELSLALAKQNNLDIGASTEAQVRDLYRFVDFKHFLHLYGELTFLLAEPADFTRAVASYARQLAAQGAIYAEMTITLGTHVHFKGMDPEEVMAAAWLGAQEAEEYGVVIRFIIDHVRSFSLERCLETVRWCHRYRNYGVVGFGLAGPEDGWPASTYAPAISDAQLLGVPFVPHAGEAVGPDGIWDALKFNPARIGHGLAAGEDNDLIDTLRQRNIAVEICPSSNVVLGHASSYAQHPARLLYERGVAISINTDDPPMFATNLVREYALLRRHCGFSTDELTEINRRAVEQILAGPNVQRQLRARFAK